MSDTTNDQVSTSAAAEDGGEDLDALFNDFAAGASPRTLETRVSTVDAEGNEERQKDGDDEDEIDEDQSEDDDGAEDTSAPVEETLEQLRERNKQLEHKLNSSKGREAAASRKIAELSAKIATNTKVVEAAKKADPAKARERAAKVKAAREEFGDVVGPVLDEIEELRARQADELRLKEEDLKADKKALDALYDEQQSQFLKTNPDGFEVLEKNAKAFLDWIDDQPRVLRDAFKANEQAITNAAQAALLVGKFKEHLAGQKTPSPQSSLSQRRARQLEGAGGEKNQRARPATTSPGDNADPSALFNHFSSVIQKQMGR